MADAVRAREALAGHDAICNMAERRYDFAVILLAAMMAGQTTILPPSRAEAAVTLTLDGMHSPCQVKSLEQIGVTRAGNDGDLDPPVMEPRSAEFRGQVHVFTSGSTGLPIRHIKTWDSLAAGATLTAEIIARAGLDISSTLVVGTVPHQHMYGLEASMFVGLAHEFCLADAKVFYPSDLEEAVKHAKEQGFRDVVLVSSPSHLRYLEQAIRTMPEISCIISATAPLHVDLERRLEQGGRRTLFEIYGSTETGSLAWRRRALTEDWTLLDGFRLYSDNGGWLAAAPHLPETTQLCDDIEMTEHGHFRLLGRRGEIVTVAGKRERLDALNAALLAVPGIQDGVVVRKTENDEDHLKLIVVPMEGAYPVDRESLRVRVRRHMLKHVDPIFVPRQIVLVDEIVRDSTGKVTAASIEALLGGVRRGVTR